ncbi:peroxisome biogenesis protein 1-like [Diaphorina citri]|uniref:Peroxisome biogenesis protein 1-like n=1 Tax=Diaphorina citri TaxID=121845 RepID=A0A1S3DDF5_DIACI|nr:peroxisome biogenesis protein 1-like [Diaphorina citri]
MLNQTYLGEKKKEREDILSVLTQKLKLNSDVNLTEIAQCTERFTGADLLGLLCSAQMLRQEYDEKEREDILSVLTQKLKLNSDVNLTEIAQCTERFTGADLLGLLCSAQMLRQEYDEESSEEPEITQADLLKALEDTKPSLSAADSFKFEQIFYNFANNRGLSSDEIQKQKVISA